MDDPFYVVGCKFLAMHGDVESQTVSGFNFNNRKHSAQCVDDQCRPRRRQAECSFVCFIRYPPRIMHGTNIIAWIAFLQRQRRCGRCGRNFVHFFLFIHTRCSRAFFPMMTTLLDGRGIDVNRGTMPNQTNVAHTVTTSQSERHAENSMNQRCRNKESGSLFQSNKPHVWTVSAALKFLFHIF